MHNIIEKQIETEYHDSSELDIQNGNENLSAVDLDNRIEKQIMIENHKETQLHENKQDASDNLTLVEDTVEKQIEVKNQDETDKKTPDTIADLSLQKRNKDLSDQKEKETLKEEDTTFSYSPKKETYQCNINREEEKSNSSIDLPLKSLAKERCTSPPSEIKATRDNKLTSNLQKENVVAEIDLTILSPPRRSIKSPIRFNSESKREYVNPFQRKINFPDNENREFCSPVKEFCSPFKSESKRNYVNPLQRKINFPDNENKDFCSPVKEQRKKFVPPSNFEPSK